MVANQLLLASTIPPHLNFKARAGFYLQNILVSWSDLLLRLRNQWPWYAFNSATLLYVFKLQVNAFYVTTPFTEDTFHHQTKKRDNLRLLLSNLLGVPDIIWPRISLIFSKNNLSRSIRDSNPWSLGWQPNTLINWANRPFARLSELSF